ncbi:MAG: UDP-N-acetylmuramoyl-L-alanine--D-glutamate ligase [Chlamydiota bacterium]|nr:UDP-N-acetylmuramoyl-L-alanine--D-glutamate ligase [Chlamydiota bacterium]
MENLNKKVVVIGIGVSGRSAAHFLLKKGFSVVGVDDHVDKLKNHPEVKNLVNSGMTLQSDLMEQHYEELLFVVTSPGIPSSHLVLKKARSKNIEIIGEVELAFRYLGEKTCVGVTGTNGKTTVTLLIEHILNACGKPARAVGNIGVPITSQILDAANEILVIELSSYQLESVVSPTLDVAVILNITPDHLDRYKTMQAYIDAKIRISNILRPQGALLASRLVPVPECIEGVIRYGFEEDCKIYSDGKNILVDGIVIGQIPEEYYGKKTHHLENILAAYSVCVKLGVSSQDALKAVCSFKRPAHRIEFVRKIDKVAYYNDSKGTNVDAVVRAVDSMNGDVILIAGGVDKGGDYGLWTKKFPGKVKCVYAIGEAAKKIQNQLAPNVHVKIVSHLIDAVKEAKAVSVPGDNVLLSPGCSSFDMFENYEHRGNEFKQIVNAITGKEKREYEPT